MDHGRLRRHLSQDPDLPGVDLVLPDIRYLASERKSLKAIFITHAHEDHYGALADLWPGLNVPVYASAFTAGLLEAKRNFEKSAIGEIPVTLFTAGDTVNAGPFSVEGVAVNHSIPEPMSLVIRTPLGNVIHTGDWKIDHEPSLGPLTDETRFRQLGDEGVLALMCDSTNALRDGVSPSEKDVSESLRKIIENAEGRVAVTTFSSNVGRIRTVAEAAEAEGREVLLLGSSLKRVVDVSRDIGLMEGIKPFISEDEYGYIPRDKVVVILTGSQGEPRAALAKLSAMRCATWRLPPGDIVVFSSRAIPGNEKAIQDIKNGLIEQGVHVITDNEALVHVSGHPRRNELQKMYELTRPKIVVPVHGEATHPDGAQGTCGAVRHLDRAARAQRRYPSPGAGAGRGDRRGAARPHLQGRLADRRLRRDGHRRAQEALLCRPRRRQRRDRQPLRYRRRSGSCRNRPACL